MALRLSANAKFLFIGDSITDCGRGSDKDGLGSGYVRLVRDYLAAKDPGHVPQVINHGISGNKVTDLANRWQRDVLAVEPVVLSIKIGINDVWHGLDARGKGVSLDTYRQTYADLLRQTKEKLPQCALVLCEPTVISPPAHEKGNESLAPYVKAVQELGQQYGAVVVPLHQPFLDAQRTRRDIDWASDGVHPTSAGHMLIARQWLIATELL